MDFSIILVGGHALRKSVLTISTKHVKMIFLYCCPRAQFVMSRYIFDSSWIYLLSQSQTCNCAEKWHVSINTGCLKQHLTTLSPRLGSPGLSYYFKAENMYPGPEVEHRQQTAAASTSWKLSSWLSLIWSWCLRWKQNRRPNHIRKITSFFRIASFCPQEI